ncbi:MFS transporter [Spirochaeta isovalerica]|uniref:GPH family glycoside/pentoside/hexuronide:cation symporter n=1 Tax=Spirochaeta isovalerica TaxID=150 RepID=A0A841R4A8_9SPIO|nr:MFS transporter [Spirochaeta isovalerica]MBB6479944.1 GPH family glycoside/pentoside/hexuronide:cation symporter [Spirochaeta isovalerica]
MELSSYYTFNKKILINLITGGMALVNIIVTSSLMKFYTDVVGMSPAMFGAVFLVFSIWNGLNDPMVGYWADKRPFKERQGKYRPLIRWSIPVIAATIIPVFFASPGWPDIIAVVYLLVLLVIYEGTKTMLDVSFNAFKMNTFLAMKDRTEVQVIGGYVTMIPIFIGGMIPVWFLTGEFSRLSIVLIFSSCIIFGLLLTWIGSLFVKEDPEFYAHMEMSRGLKELGRLFLDLIKHKSFLYFVIGFFLINSATGNYFTGYLYYMDNVLLVSGMKATIPDVLTGIFQMAIFPLIVLGVKKYGSRNVLTTGLLISVAGHATLSLPINYWVAAATYIVILGGYAFSGAINQPLLGLVVDDVELKTGKRQPGVVAGIIAVFLTPAASVQPVILSSLMSAAGYVGTTKEQSVEAVRAIRLGTGIIPAVILLAGILILSRMPINHKREKEIEQAIDAKHKGKRNPIIDSDPESPGGLGMPLPAMD